MRQHESKAKTISPFFAVMSFILLQCLTLSTWASPWSDSLKNAVVNNDPMTAIRLSKTVETDCNFISLYPDLDEASQLQMMQIFLQGATNLNAKRKADFSEVLAAILDQKSASTKLKAEVLTNLPLFPGTTEETSYYRFIASPDSLIKAAAYRGLSKKIRLNKDAKKSADNLKIFKTLTQSSASNLDPDLIRVIASIGEKYSRDYLNNMYQKDSEKLALIQSYDEDLALTKTKSVTK